MALTPGTRLGPYEVTARIGAGGMGEVYRATDTKLKRDVAVKVLPAALASDPDRLARFQREAEVLASLNHPNIAAIHGLEEAEGVRALVLELVEGETLADLIAAGSSGESKAPPIPINDAITIAKQIADALEAAHEQGIVHRDLKPSNIKVRPDGTVKVLDFGLAKLVGAGGAGGAGGASGAIGHTQSPTITTPAMTQMGVIMGTAAYMSPEQAKGREADKRSDVWAFGAVLYEMVTGRRAFDGEDMSDTLASVLKSDPDWTRLPAGVPPPVRTLMQRCLVKDRRQRVSEISTAKFILSELPSITGSQAAASTTAALGTTPRSHGQRVLPVAAAVALTAIIVGAAAWAMRPDPPRLTRLTIASSSAAALTVGGVSRTVAITPDGTHAVYVGNNGTQLLVRALDQLDPTPLTGLGTPSGPFLSPDGQSIGFFDGVTTLKRVAINGGPPVTVCRLDGGALGATWGPDGTIIFATNSAASGLQQVSAASGEPTVLTKPNRERGEFDHQWPEFLPGGHAVLFTIIAATGSENAQVAVLDLRSGAQKILVRGGSHAHYVPSGHLVYGVAGTLRAVTFDLDRLEAGSTPIPVVPEVLTTSLGAADFDVAQDGTLVYVSGGGQVDARTLVWVDRGGREETLGAEVRRYVYPRLSPKGTQVAVAILDQERDIWVWDLGRQNLTRLTVDPAEDRYPVWTPDGQRLVWDSTRAGPYNLYWQAADGAGAVERLTTSQNTHASHSFTPDGKQLVLRDDAPGTNSDLAVLNLDGERSVTPLLHAPFNERNGEISPDGRWLAYESDESGQFEVYVRPFPNVDARKWTVSKGGGRQPLWAASRRELFYRASDGSVVGVTVNAAAGSGEFETGPPATVVRSGYYQGAGAVFGRTYDVSLDGKRFLMIKQGGGTDEAAAAVPTITVVQNWFEELKRLVPSK